VNDDLRIRQALLDAALADFHHTDQTDIPSSPFQHSSRTRTYHQNLSPLIQQTLFNSTTCHMHGGAAQPEDSDFSPQYLAWENKFLRNPQAFAQRALRPLWKTVLRSAACFLLVVSLSFGSLMAFSPQARAWVGSWFTEWYEDHVTYRFTGENLPTEALRDWALGYLPEGYVQTNYIDLPGVVSILYNNDDPTTEIEFSYQLLTEGGSKHLDNERHTPSPVSIHGIQGEFWEATDGSQNFLV
jgi:hypothetical protein